MMASKTTLGDILNLIETHRKENREVLAKLGARIIEQEQELSKLLTAYVVAEDSSASTKDLLNKAKVRDLEYWYTPLVDISGYDDLPERVRNFLRFYKYLGDLATIDKTVPLREPNFGSASLKKLETWMKSLGEKLGQNLKEYRENQALLRYFNERISYGKDGHAEYRKLRYETYHEVTDMKIYTIGELCTSEMVYMTMSDVDL